ncbi:MAG: protein kinase [Chromatiales bacterium]
MPATLEVGVGQYSDRGRKEINQDFHGAMFPAEPLRTTKGIAIAIADGISSSEAGQIAAEACVTGFLEDYFCTPESWTVRKSAQKVLTALNSWLYSQYSEPARIHVSTLSALVIKSATAHLFHVGDSRIYRLRDGQIEQITTDHRVWVSAERNYLSRAMGADTRLDIDYFQVPVAQDDIFVLATDGVHDYLDRNHLVGLIAQGGDNLDGSSKAIVETALARGSLDNLTCQVVRVLSLPLRDPDEVYRQLTALPFPPELEPGMVIDGYRILRDLHTSKRTQIYLALDIEADMRVVLKTPSVNYQDDPVYLECFLLEEWIGRRIDNPHVLKTRGNERRRRFLYHVTEYIEGQTLRQWMHDHPERRLEEVRGILEQAAKGLQAFHRMEMLHQDLKPENLMIDSMGTVKIIDFGSAKVAGLAEIATPIERLQVQGTRNYTAPEYLLGEPGSNRSDIFSLGVIAYELLTGRLPYGEMPEHCPAALPATRWRYTSARDYNAALPPWIDGALRKAVHSDPTRRCAELSEFLHDLRRPNPEYTRPQQRSLLERNPVGFWRALAILLLFTVACLLFLLSR